MEKVQEIDDAYPGIFQITQDDVSKLEKKINSEEKSLETLERLTANYL